MKNKKYVFLYNFLITATFITAFVLGVVVSYSLAVWVAPTEEAPNGNSTAPINLGDNLQFKKGSLFIGNNLVGGRANETALGVVGGNVGIGTATPGTKLEVYKGNDATSAILLSNNNYYGVRTTTNVPIRLIGLEAGNDVYLGAIDNAGGSVIIREDGNNAITISGGNVGIGTTKPGTKLEVYKGNDATSAILLSNNNYYGVRTTTNVPIRLIGLEAGNDVYLGAIDNAGGSVIIREDGNNAITISGGNVGIGTAASPSAHLLVTRGTAGDSGTAVFVGTQHASYFNYSTSEDTYIRGGKNTSSVVIGDSGTGATYLSSSGGVSVGGALRVGGAILPSYSQWGSYGEGAGGAAIYNHNGSPYYSLLIVGNNSYGDGLRRVRIYDWLEIYTGGICLQDGCRSTWSGVVGGGGVGVASSEAVVPVHITPGGAAYDNKGVPALPFPSGQYNGSKSDIEGSGCTGEDSSVYKTCFNVTVTGSICYLTRVSTSKGCRIVEVDKNHWKLVSGKDVETDHPCGMRCN